ncbi:MAG: AMP-binding protein [Gammaproteobacteria bacterium]
MAASLALLTHTPGAPFAWAGQHIITREQFLRAVLHLSNNLPDKRFAVNLCNDRYWFTVAFAAALVRGQTSLLPGSRLPHDIASTCANYPDNYSLTDEDVRNIVYDLRPSQSPLDWVIPVPEIDGDHIAAITFTSGSTGQPQPHPKSWASLVKCAGLTQRHFAVTASNALLATVPPQHMYGLETSVMLPLISAASIQRGRPLFPEDIRQALLALPAPRILITTPVHLRACCQTGADWPALQLVLSATAPLDSELARRAEALFKAPVREIYGCTEGGSLASRRTVSGNRWRVFDGIQMQFREETCWMSGGHLDAPVALSDVLEPLTADAFRLLGRHSDMVNIAGKRSSLSSLNHHLNAIAGVQDGVFVLPDEADSAQAAPQRLSALVVAPSLSEKAILAALATRIDVAFLPRPLYRVAQLPRNDTGKLPRRQLLALLQRLKPHA